MTRTEQFKEVRIIADDVCSGFTTPEQLVRLEQLLTGNFEAQRFYYEYINMHSRLSNKPKLGAELVYRRITEEVVVRPEEPQPKPQLQSNELLADEQPNRQSILKWLTLLVVLCVVVGVLWGLVSRTGASYVAHIIDGKVTLVGQGGIENNALLAGVYRAEQQATLKLLDGDTLQLGPNSLIKVFNNREIRLRAGKLTLKASTPQSTLIHIEGGMLHTNGGDLSIDLRNPAPRLTSGANTVLVPARWRPNHFWAFNTQKDRVVDSAGQAYGVFGTGVTRSQGIVGQGAMIFDNSADARIDLGSGGGTARGTGSFAATDGVTIEALIRPKYTTAPDAIHEIFRKDSLGGRMRLSLNRAPSGALEISFGLFVLGYGYQELKLPLDGVEGRLSVADLIKNDYQHIAATYYAATGEKAIYVNGKKQVSYQYPPRSKMLSGGPGSAIIGNTPREPLWYKSAFSGVIDEVAFYDFALSEYMINLHIKHIQQSFNYYGLPANTLATDVALPDRLRLTLIPHTKYELTPSLGLPQKIVTD